YQTAAEMHTDLVTVRRMLEGSPSADSARLRSGPASWQGSSSTAAASAVDRLQRKWMAVPIAAGVVVLAAAGWKVWWGAPRRPPALSAETASFSQLTSLSGLELFPTLSPDGKSVAYASQTSGNWDIYVQRVGGRNPLNLTRDSPAADTQPAFSPDGE